MNELLAISLVLACFLAFIGVMTYLLPKIRDSIVQRTFSVVVYIAVLASCWLLLINWIHLAEVLR